jgi:hypothetical protein
MAACLTAFSLSAAALAAGVSASWRASMVGLGDDISRAVNILAGILAVLWDPFAVLLLVASARQLPTPVAKPIVKPVRKPKAKSVAKRKAPSKSSRRRTTTSCGSNQQRDATISW